jgi:hypothetical protein
MSIAFGEKGAIAWFCISVHQRTALFCISEYKCASAVSVTPGYVEYRLWRKGGHRVMLHQRSSAFISVHQCSSVFISVHQCSSVFISVHQRSVLFCISVHQCSSAVASTKIRWPIDRGGGRNPHTIFGRRVIEL